jgi:hypothetical protein
MNVESSLADVFARILKESDTHQDAIDTFYQSLRDQGLLSRVTMHRYQCKRGCQIAIVFGYRGLTLCAVRDYKYSPGMNKAQSVESARQKNTLDGDRHWPSHVYDVRRLDAFSAGEQKAGISMNCRHHTGTVLAADILAAVEGLRPGQKIPPTRL